MRTEQRQPGGEQVEFKVASEDWSTVDLGSQAGDQVVVEQEEKVLATGGSNLQFTPSVDATYLFTLDATDTSAPVLTVENEEPYVGTTVYLRGGFNGWGTDNPFEYDGGRIYSSSLNLEAGSYEFKVATDDWSTVNLGAESPDDAARTVVLGEDMMLAQSDNNLLIDIESEESYVFLFDVSTLEEPKLRVFKEQFFGATPVFIRGGMNGWGTDDELVYQGAGVYSVDIELSGGANEFKVASDDWATVNLGKPAEAASNAVEVGVPKSIATSNDNLLIEAPAGLYEFKIEGPDANNPTITVIEK